MGIGGEVMTFEIPARNGVTPPRTTATVSGRRQCKHMGFGGGGVAWEMLDIFIVVHLTNGRSIYEEG